VTAWSAAAALRPGEVSVASSKEPSALIRRVLGVGEDVVVGLLAILALPLVILAIGLPIAAVVRVLLWAGSML